LQARAVVVAISGVGLCSGYLRGLGLSPNQALHVPGAGDFHIERIDGPQEPAPAVGAAFRQKDRPLPGAGGAEAMDASGGQAPVLATADLSAREPLTRENVPDPLAGEQTWPTEEVRTSPFLSFDQPCQAALPELHLAAIDASLVGSVSGTGLAVSVDATCALATEAFAERLPVL
jgi:AARP2CN (NUC121) domain